MCLFLLCRDRFCVSMVTCKHQTTLDCGFYSSGLLCLLLLSTAGTVKLSSQERYSEAFQNDISSTDLGVRLNSAGGLTLYTILSTASFRVPM